MRLAVFASGRGSNFQALLDASRAGKLPEAEFVLLFSDKKDARALTLASEAGIATRHVAPRDFESREAYEEAVLEHLREAGVEAICLAGYMRLVGKVLLEAAVMEASGTLSVSGRITRTSFGSVPRIWQAINACVLYGPCPRSAEPE